MKKVKKGILKNYREVGLQYRNMPFIYFFLNNKAYFHKKKIRMQWIPFLILKFLIYHESGTYTFLMNVRGLNFGSLRRSRVGGGCCYALPAASASEPGESFRAGPV